MAQIELNCGMWFSYRGTDLKMIYSTCELNCGITLTYGSAYRLKNDDTNLIYNGTYELKNDGTNLKNDATSLFIWWYGQTLLNN